MDNDHIVKSFDEELGRLDYLIAEMGGLAEAQLAEAMIALQGRDVKSAKAVAKGDKPIDALEEEIDQLVVRLLALRQPMAKDLRIIISALKTAGNLERLGDYAKNIGRRTVTIGKAHPLKGAANTLARMGELVRNMIHSVLDAYVARDAELALDVRNQDEEVDQLHTSLFRELLTYMMEDPRNITSCTHMLFIAKNVERMGDHVTNIAEQVYYMVHGQAPEEARPKGDKASSFVLEMDGDKDKGKDRGKGKKK